LTPDAQISGFRERIRSGPVIVSDGATGSELQRRDLPVGIAPEAWTFDRPEEVSCLVSEYVEAGAECVLTNTFGANRVRWTMTGRSETVAQVNRRAVELARTAVGDQGYVVGAVGPTGEDLTSDQYHQVYTEQVNALVEAGVDGICVETACSSTEGFAAVDAGRSISDVPVILSFAVRLGRGLETLAGELLEDVVARVSASGADVVGINCVGFDLAREAIRLIQEVTDLPIAFSPNAGIPQQGAQGLQYPDSEAELASRTTPLMSSRVRIVGGCCGTGPKYVKALRKAVGEQV
jgi:5-methyltetrahydrofolate--homocysteine methyltransferase